MRGCVSGWRNRVPPLRGRGGATAGGVAGGRGGRAWRGGDAVAQWAGKVVARRGAAQCVGRVDARGGAAQWVGRVVARRGAMVERLCRATPR
jgi:hypothetical protein